MTDVASRVANLYSSRFLRSYAVSKLRRDPIYRAVAERLRNTGGTIFDVGCGVGLLEFFLRECDIKNRIIAVDHDPRKIAQAQAIAQRYSDLEFSVADAREPIPPGSNVLLIDVLHYLSDDDQKSILLNAATSGGLVIIRDAIRDGSLRYRVTAAQETFSRAIRWLRADRLNFPTREQITALFGGFVGEITPMWGTTPFNNYLFVFNRHGETASRPQ